MDAYAVETRAASEGKGKLGNVNSRVGRIALIVIGVIAVIIGGVFAGQGTNLIPGSFMTGNRMWLFIGLIVVIVGIVLLVLGLRRPKTGRRGKSGPGGPRV